MYITVASYLRFLRSPAFDVIFFCSRMLCPHLSRTRIRTSKPHTLLLFLTLDPGLLSGLNWNLWHGTHGFHRIICQAGWLAICPSLLLCAFLAPLYSTFAIAMLLYAPTLLVPPSRLLSRLPISGTLGRSHHVSRTHPINLLLLTYTS